MPDTPLAKRRRIHAQLDNLEPLVAGYRAMLRDVNAAIQELDPQLFIPPRRYQANPVFKRGGLPRTALAVRREAGELRRSVSAQGQITRLLGPNVRNNILPLFTIRVSVISGVCLERTAAPFSAFDQLVMPITCSSRACESQLFASCT